MSTVENNQSFADLKSEYNEVDKNLQYIVYKIDHNIKLLEDHLFDRAGGGDTIDEGTPKYIEFDIMNTISHYEQEEEINLNKKEYLRAKMLQTKMNKILIDNQSQGFGKWRKTVQHCSVKPLPLSLVTKQMTYKNGIKKILKELTDFDNECVKFSVKEITNCGINKGFWSSKKPFKYNDVTEQRRVVYQHLEKLKARNKVKRYDGSPLKYGLL